MERRQYLGVLTGGSLVVTSGCLGSLTGGGSDDNNANDGDDGGEEPTEDTTTTTADTATETQTRTTTTTSEPDPQPRVSDFGPVYEWADFGDAVDNQMTAVIPGVAVPFAYHFSAVPVEGEVSIDEQVSVYDANGSRVAQTQETTRSLESGDERLEFEHAVFVDARGWDTGQYEAELRLRETNKGVTSEPEITRFNVRQPLSTRDVTVQQVDAPRFVNVGESYDFRIVFENTSSTDGGVRTPLSARRAGGRWQRFGNPLGLLLHAGGTNDWQSAESSFDRTGQVEFRLDEFGYTWSVTVE